MAETAPEACYLTIAVPRKTGGIVKDTTASVDAKRIKNRTKENNSQCRELILINYWRPAPISVT